MTRSSSNIWHGGWARWLCASVGSWGFLSATGCLVPDADYCAFVYGDRSCPEDRSFCVLAKEPTSHTNIDDGCSATVPDGFVRVHYGLPTSVAAPAERPDDPRSLGGVLAHLGYEACVTTDEIEASLGPLVASVAEVRRHLGERGHVRRRAMSLSREHVDAIEAFDEAVTAWVAECLPSETETTGSSSQSWGTTGEAPCTSHESCPDDAPLCDPVTGDCVTCDALVDPDAGCAELDPELPVCTDGACVECTETSTALCTGTDPSCDVHTNTCIPCTSHDQCGEAACNLFTGSCLPEEAVVHVGPGQWFPTPSSAAESVEPGAEGTIIVHLDSYDESVTVEEGRVLAFLAADVGPAVDPPQWTNTSGTVSQLTVRTSATVIMDGMLVSSNTSSSEPGLLIDGGRAWIDRTRVTSNSGGGMVARASATLTLRNSFVGGNVSNRHALEVDDATANIVYTTLGAGSGTSRALTFSGKATVSVRNSMILALSSEDEVTCPTATIEDSAAELDLGVSNTGLGGMSTLWFASYASGDFHLAPGSPSAIAATADWRANDPPTDIDGDPRPTEDNSIDYVGADVP